MILQEENYCSKYERVILETATDSEVQSLKQK